MSVHASQAHPSRKPLWRRQTFWKVTLPVVAGLAAIFAGIVVYNAFYGSNGLSLNNNGTLPKEAPIPKTVKLDKSVHGLILQFVKTAVARKNLGEAYRLIGPGLREGITLKQWEEGNVTVVPYPVDNKTTLAYEKPDYSYATKARVQVHVVTPDEPTQTRAQPTNTFFVTVVKRQGRWLVDNWVPRWTPPIPVNN
jgi:hypothetical protein